MGRRGRLWLLGPALVLCAADVGLTLAGQSPDYWAGNFATAEEGNPLARPILAAGPSVFAAAAATWLAVVSAVVLLWRHPAARWLAIAVAVGHAIGGASWLARHGGWWLLAGCGYLAAAAVFSRWCWGHAARITSSASQAPPS